ncbi:FAD-dependent oxidoreductase [Amycolatopsis nigrescens]|uniref:FAD-dependent oxidoreductase n=1 Tax=Amycolatopsis nigrescens TaxID=381445 RepID=UPI0003607871|nr:FAD-dependent monooxygenase [Amycolatopsis nigrescens]
MVDAQVIVIGAGLGGLCLAQGLRRAGVSFAVYERDESPVIRGQGYRIHIDARGDRALAETLSPAAHRLFRATSGTPEPRSTWFNHQLRQVHSVELPGSPHLAVNRLTLRRILLSDVADAVSFGKRFTHYEVHGESGGEDTVTAHFADGSTATGAVLVAADGVNSLVRKQYLPHARVVDTGLRQLYGKVQLTARTRELFSEDMFTVFTGIVGPNFNFLGVAPVEYPEPVERAAARLAPSVALPAAADYMTCAFGARAEHLPISDEELRTLSGTRAKALVADVLGDWHPQVRRIVEHWDLDSVFPLALRTSVPIEPWPTTNVTLLGDAIHAMSPAGGIGANIALRDASALAAALAEVADGKPVVPALQAYETEMTEIGFDAVRASAANGHQFLGQNPLPD